MRSLPLEPLGSVSGARAPGRRSPHPVLAQLRRSRGVWIGGVLLAVLILCAVAAPLLAPDAPNAQNWENRLLPPGAGHPFGTDEFGRSVLTRVLYGGRVSLLSGFLPVVLAASIGTLIGLVAGYGGRLADALLTSVVDVLMAFPGLLLALAIIGLFGPSFSNAVLAIGIVGIPIYARLVRAEVLKLRDLEFVEAARALGMSPGRVVWRHLLPNVASPLVVQATLSVGAAILATASLSFLGLGVQPPTSDWGEMLASGRAQLPHAWWLEVFPGLMITLTVLAVNLLGDGLRDALDPRTTR